jgi:hypothetical protein
MREDDDETNYEFNINAGSYESLVNNPVATLGERSTWRHMLTVVLEIGGRNYRVSCKNILHKQRCLNCSMTNKGFGFCYIKVRDKDSTLREPVKQALRMWYSELQLQQEPDVAPESVLHSRSLIRNGLTIFPPPETLKQTDGKKRIPLAHSLPSVIETFNSSDDGMNSFLRINIFKNLCCTPIRIQLDFGVWTENDTAVQNRQTAFAALVDDWHEAKHELHKIVKQIEQSWFNARHNKKCVVGGCKECKALQKELKIQFRGLIQKGYEEHIKDLLMKRKSFLRNVPKILDDNGYEDDQVRIIALNYNCRKTSCNGVKTTAKKTGGAGRAKKVLPSQEHEFAAIKPITASHDEKKETKKEESKTKKRKIQSTFLCKQSDVRVEQL